jgi:predicted ArsR family transcriptional regulator
MLPQTEAKILHLVAHYHTLTRAQVNRLLFPSDRSGRATRKHLQNLLNLNLLNRCRMEVVNPAMGAPAPVYFPSRDGVAYLAQETRDDSYLRVSTQPPQWMHLYHFVAVAETHILLDRAAAMADATIVEWIGEYDLADADQTLPERRYRLYSRLTDKLVCVPDAAFLLERNDQRRVFYLEQDRDTTKAAQQFAARKCNGYAGLLEQRGHGRHFQGMGGEEFRVLVVAPSVNRRDALRKAVAQKPASWLWRFASLTDLTADTMLTGCVWFKCVGDEPGTLLASRQVATV